MRMSCQVALYPLNTLDAAAVIADILNEMDWEGVEVETGGMSTVISGEEPFVWAKLQALYRMAASDYQIVLTTTLSNECGCEGGCYADHRGRDEGAAPESSARKDDPSHGR